MTNDDGGFFGKLLDKIFGAGAEKQQDSPGRKQSADTSKDRKEAKQKAFEDRGKVLKQREKELDGAKPKDPRDVRGMMAWQDAKQRQTRKHASEREQDQNELDHER